MKYYNYLKFVNFTNIFSKNADLVLTIGENSAAMHGWRKIVLMKPHLYFFPETLQIICIC